MKWDIFCKVIDNHGDAGVCWRLAAELGARGDLARLWIDDPSALAWMAPAGATGVEVVPWREPAPALQPHDVVIEAFGCDPPADFIARMAAAATPPAWINLEYLSAEPYVERTHGLPSAASHGPGAGLAKFFFYPGFTQRTGGLLREQDLAQRRAGFDRDGWLARQGVPPDAGQVISLFCYEPPALAALLRQLERAPRRTHLLVTAGRAAKAVQALGATSAGQLQLHFLSLLSQRDYDHLLWSCDLNFVRGEDSVVRAVLAGVPCVWQIYPQDDQAHVPKLEAFLDWLGPPADQRDFFLAWNGVGPTLLLPPDMARWRAAAAAAAARADALPELATALRRFAVERGRI